MNKIFKTFAVILLIYMLWPGSKGISDFKPLPDSAKSTLSGDTVQIPNVSAYFSYQFRNFVIPFYYKNFQEASHFPFPPLKLNHPPEYSWTVIKKPTDTTYLEEFIYPLRDSLYINGFENHHPDGSKVFYGSPELREDGKLWYTKTTLRLYTSNILVRILVWFGIVFSFIYISKLGRSILKE
ncbi:hypothetical protein A3C59_04750 [Candidatus Daviesbacteria bacterium RIFCSPHIGHO2_02_FULL_36_13]|uniref:Uncharacterized protein n=1 Tax=Candidatus Daviesbacteria bacterium RIFCSPHIGHO2_02_FULL_36_13 TaxID=1797768 RepID=A0A1F5JNU0_9BACT|nr:MAG: hypothetical protein A3C59_04750 [Candidatus Daviesbacteria bacterium RIFCSPHIGHO2_02_FULL_36_13]